MDFVNTIQLEHPSIPKCYVWEFLLKDCLNLSTFCGRINKIAEKITLFDIDKNIPNEFYYLSSTDGANKFKGDVFEIFCELLIRLSPIDDRIGISDYHVVTEGDTGVDGYGTSRDGSVVTVQCKYRLWDWELTAIKEHLNNFRLTSYQKYKIDPKAEGKMLVLTTGKEIHWETLERQFIGKVRCISNDASYKCLNGGQNHTIDKLFSLRTIVNDNVYFWNTFRKQTKK
jgi:hypothetical protein